MSLLTRFKDFVSKKYRVKKPIKLYHGAHKAQKSLSLPATYSKARAADGHAVYLSTSKDEAGTYGKNLHHVEFHTHKDHLIDLDRPIHEQSAHVKGVIKKLTNNNVDKDPWEKQPIGLSFVQHVTKHITKDPIKTTKLLYSHGIHGGFGSSYSPKSKRSDSTVYSVYNPKKHLAVTKVDSNE